MTLRHLPEPNVVEAVADLLDLGVPLEGDPASPEKSAFRLGIRNCGAEKSGKPEKEPEKHETDIQMFHFAAAKALFSDLTSNLASTYGIIEL